MKPILKRLIAVSGMCALAAGLSFAQGPAVPPASGPHGEHGPLGRLTSQLNLSADQQTQVKAIFDQERQSAEPLRAQLTSLHPAVEAAIKANDTAQLTQLATNIGSLTGQMEALRLLAQAKIYALLTPAQQAEFGVGGSRGGWGPGGPMHNGNR